MTWGTLSRAERDAAYNNSAAVADSAQYAPRWLAASAPLRAARPGLVDIPYATKERTKWDLFPAADAGAPCDWLNEHRRQHGIAGPLILSGWSAGGHLAALLLDHPCIAAGCAISGVYELGPIRDTYLNEKVQLTDTEIETLSPLRLPQPDKPLTITYGTRELDALVGSSRELHAKRAALHLPVAQLAGVVCGTVSAHCASVVQLAVPSGAVPPSLPEALPGVPLLPLTHEPALSATVMATTSLAGSHLKRFMQASSPRRSLAHARPGDAGFARPAGLAT